MNFTAYLNVNNIDKMLLANPKHFSWIGFDSIDNCNLHCVYCHNPRTKKSIDLDLLQRFLDHQILSIDTFQVGCQMEPTLDKRLTDILKMISNSPGRPSKQFKVHTNGTLLNRHDHQLMMEAGLTHLSVSIDTAREETFSSLRGGAKLSRVFRNLEQFNRSCPHVVVQFIATVTTENINEISDLIIEGEKVGANRFHFREMFFDSRSQIVDHEKMRKLLLPPGAFSKMQTKIQERFQHVALHFIDSGSALKYGQQAKSNSQN